MKKIRILVLFSLLFLLSGCSATFDVTIDPAIVEQLIEIEMDKTEIKNDDIFGTMSDIMLDIEYDSESLGYYKTKEKIENGIGLLQASIEYAVKDYTSDHAIIFCYDEVSMIPNEKGIDIKTSEQFTCFDKYTMLDEVTLKVKVKGKVLDNNADSKDGNTYIWNINKENANNRSIILSVEWKEKSMTTVYIMGGIIGVIVLGLTLNFYIKYKKVNGY